MKCDLADRKVCVICESAEMLKSRSLSIASGIGLRNCGFNFQIQVCNSRHQNCSVRTSGFAINTYVDGQPLGGGLVQPIAETETPKGKTHTEATRMHCTRGGGILDVQVDYLLSAQAACPHTPRIHLLAECQLPIASYFSMQASPCHMQFDARSNFKAR